MNPDEALVHFGSAIAPVFDEGGVVMAHMNGPTGGIFLAISGSSPNFNVPFLAFAPSVPVPNADSIHNGTAVGNLFFNLVGLRNKAIASSKFCGQIANAAKCQSSRNSVVANRGYLGTAFITVVPR